MATSLAQAYMNDRLTDAAMARRTGSNPRAQIKAENGHPCTAPEKTPKMNGRESPQSTKANATCTEASIIRTKGGGKSNLSQPCRREAMTAAKSLAKKQGGSAEGRKKKKTPLRAKLNNVVQDAAARDKATLLRGDEVLHDAPARGIRSATSRLGVASTEADGPRVGGGAYDTLLLQGGPWGRLP